MTEPGTADILTSSDEEPKPPYVIEERTDSYRIRTVVYETHMVVQIYLRGGRLLTTYAEATT